ncbi:MAG: hypothetical protein Q9198_002592, partial [Flavoplaca austrocitrina]
MVGLPRKKPDPEMQRRGKSGAAAKKRKGKTEGKADHDSIPATSPSLAGSPTPTKRKAIQEHPESPNPKSQMTKPVKPKGPYLQNPEELAVNNPEAVAELYRKYEALAQSKIPKTPADPPKTTGSGSGDRPYIVSVSTDSPYILSAAWDSNNNPTANRTPSPLNFDDMTDVT